MQYHQTYRERHSADPRDEWKKPKRTNQDPAPTIRHGVRMTGFKDGHSEWVICERCEARCQRHTHKGVPIYSGGFLWLTFYNFEQECVSERLFACGCEVGDTRVRTCFGPNPLPRYDDQPGTDIRDDKAVSYWHHQVMIRWVAAKDPRLQRKDYIGQALEEARALAQGIPQQPELIPTTDDDQAYAEAFGV